MEDASYKSRKKQQTPPQAGGNKDGHGSGGATGDTAGREKVYWTGLEKVYWTGCTRTEKVYWTGKGILDWKREKVDGQRCTGLGVHEQRRRAQRRTTD